MVPTLPRSPRIALTAAVIASAAAGAGALALVGNIAVAAGFVGAGLVAGGAAIAWRILAPVPEAGPRPVDWNLARALVQSSRAAVAVTDRSGRLVCANDSFEERFPGLPTPPELPLSEAAVDALGKAGRAAWREGSARTPPGALGRSGLAASVTRAGDEADLLVWQFDGAAGGAGADDTGRALSGELGDRLGQAGIMAALIGPEGRVIAANAVLRARAVGTAEATLDGRDLGPLLSVDAGGVLRFSREGAGGPPLRLLEVPLFDAPDAPLAVALLDEEAAPALPSGDATPVRSLIAMIPLGIALVDREGRLMQMNDAFLRAAAVKPGAHPLYPGDLVVRDDKSVVADAVRRFAAGATHSSDMAVRLADRPDEPVVLTIAAARGLGDAAVLLSLKDNTEEARLKRQAEQATKMQAVGQLAGGVAHDFNNILTAILGHCDLMLMRHSPGDSDYDDIQQIRNNSGRAAALTRQLLAFSRQQTLRPQVLQLPDVVSEVSNLLRRLMGELVTMNVHHGRNLGHVRADPGQLEQVVVNLAVNARDAVLARYPQGGGQLTISTFAVSASEVERMGHSILPPADYTALEVQDNGTGIPRAVLPHIFEPFFSTKEQGKGTGLGLSTVYGIVKQSGGWIFADPDIPEGARFTIFLPVHAATVAAAAPRPAAKPASRPADLWGSGTILLVEDEDMVRAVAERALTRQGYQVLTAENGEAGLEKLAEAGRPDLIVTDVMMPTMDGPTMGRHARERYPDLPILFMSGYAEEQLRKSIDLDNISFLPKPFSVQQLAEAARDAMAGR